MKIAALFAHPDDLELWAGGTVLRQLDRGDQVTSGVYFECTAARLAEMRAARELLAVTDLVLPSPELGEVAGDHATRFLDEVPDVVLTHWVDDVHPEHRAVFAHAQRVCQLAKRRCRRTPLLLMASTYYLQGAHGAFEPEVLIEVTPAVERKVAAIRCYKSQHPERLLADVLSQNRLFGSRAGVEYAEGFIEYPLFGFTRSPLRSSLADLGR